LFAVIHTGHGEYNSLIETQLQYSSFLFPVYRLRWESG
jgi:hypothetical protein